MVVENADDGKIFFDADSGNVASEKNEGDERLASYIPRTPNGVVSITTRYKRVGFRFTNRHQDIVEIGPMADQVALPLLKQKLGDLFDDREAETSLVKKLDFIPLAISQAATSVCYTTPQTSMRDYPKMMRKRDQKQAKLLKVENPLIVETKKGATPYLTHGNYRSNTFLRGD